jgi:hypothetical protein
MRFSQVAFSVTLLVAGVSARPIPEESRTAINAVAHGQQVCVEGPTRTVRRWKVRPPPLRCATPPLVNKPGTRYEPQQTGIFVAFGLTH